MSKLYTELAAIYEAMYATFIDYKEEYNFYSDHLRKHHKKSVLEIGSGTGNLASLFSENGFDYLGLDISSEMLEMAKKKNPSCHFTMGDMRDFELDKPTESALITGRSISYLLKSEDVNATFANIHRNLQKGGLLCFDFIDANRFIPEILKTEKVIHEAKIGGEQYFRESRWGLHLEYGMDLSWEAVYSKLIGEVYEEIGRDNSILRTFTKNEMELFLDINDFRILEIIDRQTYAFPTFVMIAERK